MKHILSTLFSFIFIIAAIGQESISGRVIDSDSKEGLAFVNITYNIEKEGCITDLDGYFHIADKQKIDFIDCSFVGYKQKRVEFNGNKSFITIELQADVFKLDEVTVLPGENPAHRIINHAIENKKLHDPDKLDSYEFTSYSKMYFTADAGLFADDLERDSAGNIKDTSSVSRMVDFLEKNHLFLMESVTKKQFKSPDKAKEEILASRVSGLKHPSFTYLAAEYQSFSFYGEIIEIADNEYISPLCNNSPNKYFFLLKDTAYNASGDTTFIMSFQPKRGTNFQGLKGVIYINTNGWAIQNVIAEPAKQGSEMEVKIQQQYNQPDGEHWFPMQLNTDFIVNFVELADSSGANNSRLLGIGKTYIKDVQINQEINSRLKGGTEIVYADDALTKDSLYWNSQRTQRLDKRESNTYELIDSLGDAVNLDRKLATIEILATGKIPYGIINFDLNHLYWYNEYEGNRIGLGIETNQRLSKYFSLSAYGAYGIRDEELKYGAGIHIKPFKNDRLVLQSSYSHDIRESMMYNFQEKQLNNESYREFFLTDFDVYTTYSASILAKPFRGFHAKTYLDFNQINQDFSPIVFVLFHENKTGWETGIETKYYIKEDIVRTPQGNILSMGSKYPEIHFNLRREFPWKDDNFKPYWRFETRIHDVIETKWIGDFHFTLDGGLLYSDEPIYEQRFMLHRSGKWIESDNSFATMPYGFVTDRFAALYFKYDIGSLLFHIKSWKPEFALVSRLLVGDDKNSFSGEYYYFPNYFISPDKIYLESGLQVNAVLRQLFLKYGFGVYYNHGDYAFQSFKQDFAIKFRLEYEF